MADQFNNLTARGKKLLKSGGSAGCWVAAG